MHIVTQWFHEAYGEQGYKKHKGGKKEQAAIKIVNILCDEGLTINEAAYTLKICEESLRFTRLAVTELQ